MFLNASYYRMDFCKDLCRNTKNVFLALLKKLVIRLASREPYSSNQYFQNKIARTQYGTNLS